LISLFFRLGFGNDGDVKDSFPILCLLSINLFMFPLSSYAGEDLCASSARNAANHINSRFVSRLVDRFGNSNAHANGLISQIAEMRRNVLQMENLPNDLANAEVVGTRMYRINQMLQSTYTLWRARLSFLEKSKVSDEQWAKLEELHAPTLESDPDFFEKNPHLIGTREGFEEDARRRVVEELSTYLLRADPDLERDSIDLLRVAGDSIEYQEELKKVIVSGLSHGEFEGSLTGEQRNNFAKELVEIVVEKTSINSPRNVKLEDVYYSELSRLKWEILSASLVKPGGRQDGVSTHNEMVLGKVDELLGDGRVEGRQLQFYFFASSVEKTMKTERDFRDVLQSFLGENTAQSVLFNAGQDTLIFTSIDAKTLLKSMKEGDLPSTKLRKFLAFMNSYSEFSQGIVVGPSEDSFTPSNKPFSEVLVDSDSSGTLDAIKKAKAFIDGLDLGQSPEE